MNIERIKTTVKRFLLGGAGLITLIAGAEFVWILSGSDQWELEIDEEGVQVYSYKAPGSYVKRFKSVTQGEYSLSHLAAALLIDNDSLENCKNWIPTCVDLAVLEPFEHKAQGGSVLWTLEMMPPLFRNREYLIKSHASQDERTKVVSIDIMTAAVKLPPSECCIRIKHIHNRWQVTPMGEGRVEIELVQDFSMGGFFPDFLINIGGAEEAYKLFHEQLPALLDSEKYRQARFDFIEEVDARYIAQN